MILQWEQQDEASWYASYRTYRVEISPIAPGEPRVQVVGFSGEKPVVRREFPGVEEAKAWVEEMVRQVEVRGAGETQQTDVASTLADTSSEDRVLGPVPDSE